MLRRFLAALGALVLLALPAHSDLEVNQLVGFGVVSEPLDPTVSVTFIGCHTSASDLTTYTFNSVDTGTPNAYRKTILGFIGEDSANTFSPSSATVGGDAVSIVGASSQAFTINGGFGILANTADSSETVTVTWSEAITGMTMCVWTANNLASLTPNDTGVGQAGTGANAVIDLDVQALGIAVGMCGSPTAGVTNWSIPNMTTSFEEDTNAELSAAAGTYQEDGSASTPLSADCVSSGNQKMGVSASFL